MRTCCHLRLIYFNSAFCFIYLRKPYCASKLLSRSSWWCLFLCENPLFKSVTLFAVFARLVHAEFVTGVFSNHAARTPAQSFGDRRPGSWQNVHHKALRPPGVLPALPGHHRSGLRTQSAQLGPQNSGEAAAVGHRRYVNHTVIVLWVEWHTAAQVNAHSLTHSRNTITKGFSSRCRDDNSPLNQTQRKYLDIYSKHVRSTPNFIELFLCACAMLLPSFMKIGS